MNPASVGARDGRSRSLILLVVAALVCTMVVVVTTPANAAAGDVTGSEVVTLDPGEPPGGDVVHRWSWDARTQVVTHDGTGGTFTLTFTSNDGDEETTDPIPYDATAGQVDSAISALTSVTVNVDVQLTGVNEWTVTFPNPQRPIYAMLGDGSDLTGGSTVTIDAYRDLPVDPTGVAYIGGGHFLVSDSEIEEQTVDPGFNLWEFDPIDAQVYEDTDSTDAYSDEPTGLDYNPDNGHLFVSDDDVATVFEVDAGGNVVGSIDTDAEFEVVDTEDVAWDPSTDTLWIASGLGGDNPNSVTPVFLGANGQLGGGDDVVGDTLDLGSIGVLNLQGLGYRAETDTLLLTDADPGQTEILEITKEGRLIRTVEIPALTPSDVTVAPGSLSPGDTHVYVVASQRDSAFGADGKLPIDGRFYEFIVPFDNLTPFVDAGADEAIDQGEALTLEGDAYDDDQSVEPTVTWSELTGPGDVTFGTANSLSTTVSFSLPGTYELQLVVDDGEYQGIDTLEVEVTNAAPTVSAGADQEITLPDAATLAGSASDDGLPNPPGTLTTTWSKVSGPGTVDFDDSSSLSTTASFSEDGTYTLQLAASDSVLQSTDTVTVTVNAEDDGNGNGGVDTFTDDDDSIFEADIEWLAAAGITKGCNPPVNDEFCPDDFVTRGQMAAFLVRAMGYTAGLGADLFIDDDGTTFENDIDRLGTAGVTKGCNPPTNDEYCPDDFVTRGQMAAFLVRALGYTAGLGADLFIDDDGTTFENDIDRLGTAGVTKGCNPPTNDEYCPGDFVTRGQMAAFLHRALGS